MNGKWLMRVLCGMLVVAAVLAGISISSVRAGPPEPEGYCDYFRCWWQCTGYGCGYGTCGSDWRTVPELGYRFCCYQVCNGCPGSCCWYTGQWGCFCPHCSP
jgi:hypothetical protein